MHKERIQRLRAYIDAHGEATVAELTEVAGACSNMTLWRDLNKLEQEGFLRRTRGGVVAMRFLQPDVEGLYSQRAMENIAGKQAIARAAAARIRPNTALYLDAGSTVMQVAKLLPDEHLTIVTSGANIAIELCRRPRCNVFCVGGQVSANTLSCSGEQAENYLDSLNIDTALMATSGFSPASGFSSGSLNESRLKRKVVEKAAHTLMLMDSSKLDRSLTFTFATLADVDALICDAPLPEAVMAEMAAAGTEFILA